FAHQTQFVSAGNGRRVNLNELGVAVFRAGLISAADGATGANHRHRRTAIDETAPARGDYHRVGGKRADLHRDEVLSDAALALAVIVEDRPEKIPELKLSD